MFAADRDDLPRFTELDAEYEFLGELGRGGTAVVYLARERELDRKVAIKVIRATYVEDEEAAARLTREAHTVAGMQHPNIVMLYGTRRLRDASLALIMQYVEGRTLKHEVEETGPLSFKRAEQVLRDIGSALAYAHRHRIVHRDIKPENIYIDAETGMARLSDFGIARPWDVDSGLTLPGSAIGTPAYMSPEQIDGGVLDGRSDIYSLGLVGYEMLTGARPWAGETLFSIVVKQKHEELPPLGVGRPGVPRHLEAAIEGAIRKRADERWQTADAFLRALNGRASLPPRQPQEAPQQEAQPAQATTPPAQPTTPPEPPTPTAAAAGAAAAGAAAAPADKARGVRVKHAARLASPAGGGRRRGRGRRGRKAPPARSHTISFERAVAPETVAAAAAPAVAESAVLPERSGEPDARPAALPAPAGLRQRLRRWPVAAAAAIGAIVLGTGVTLAFRDGPGEPSPAMGVPAVAAAATEAVGPSLTDGAPATAEPPALAFALYGDQQAGVAGDTLPVPLVVRVEDAAGGAVAGVAVQFAAVGGAGSVHPATSLTDAAGTATARWLPVTPGAVEATAAVAGIDAPVRFRASALPRPAARLLAASPAEVRGIAGTPAQLAAKVEDDRGNALAGVEVRFAVRTGSGRITPASSVTGADGVARADWLLGTAGAQEAVANVPQAAAAPVVFRATATSPPLPVQRTVALGGTHTCVLAGDGTASCWGGNDRGQLGDGSASRRSAPARVAAPEPLATIAAGVSHSCAVATSGTGFCWGGNAAGQLGDGTRTARTHPTRIDTGGRLISIAVGMSHTCALDDAARLFCWGDNTHGQLGDGTRTGRATPVRAGGTRTYRSVTLGWAHTCALTTDGAAFCWGRNGSGELGDGGTGDRAEAGAVTGGHRFSAIAAGSGHTCGLSADGTILCWGQNSNGQLGNGGTVASPVPAAVSGGAAFSAVAAGGVHTCGLTRAGAAQCWGRNTYGQLGDGTTEDRAQPAPVAGGLPFSSIHASGAHTCATASGALYCWGFNLEGQIGDGTRTNQVRPVAAGRQG